jgi:hypothetical protein
VRSEDVGDVVFAAAGADAAGEDALVLVAGGGGDLGGVVSVAGVSPIGFEKVEPWFREVGPAGWMALLPVERAVTSAPSSAIRCGATA